MEALLQATLRDILCAALSLDDGLSKIQGITFRNPEESELLFDIARSIEEIILRRPGLANAKLTELAVRLSFQHNRVLPEMLILLDIQAPSEDRSANYFLTLTQFQVLLTFLVNYLRESHLQYISTFVLCCPSFPTRY